LNWGSKSDEAQSDTTLEDEGGSEDIPRRPQLKQDPKTSLRDYAGCSSACMPQASVHTVPLKMSGPETV
jgi:hypothetical protein